MNRYDTFTERICKFLHLRDSTNTRARKPQHSQIGTTQPESSTAHGELSFQGDGKPQPVCELLDKAKDIAELYSQPDGCATEAISLEYQRVFCTPRLPIPTDEEFDNYWGRGGEHEYRDDR